MSLALEKLPHRSIQAVFTDLDDTLTESGKISAATFSALERLQARGLKIVIVSGRPAGWADTLTRLWPIDAMIFENGAGFIHKQGDKLSTYDLAENATQSRARLESLFATLKTKIPAIRLAEDQPYRRFDMAIDICEELPHLPQAQVAQAVSFLQQQPGITAKLSSIHINFWVGSYTKVSASEKVLARLGVCESAAVFVGDSPNDEPLFAAFTHSVGVQNVEAFRKQMQTPPRYVTKSPNGAGFRELATLLLGSH